MKEEYDFSKGERGRFYRDDISLELPIFFEPENLTFVQKVAEQNKTDVSAVINDLIKKSMAMEEA